MNVPSVMEMMERPDSEVIIKRLLKVAEILTRKPVAANESECSVENDREKHDGDEMGYRENADHLNDT